MRKKRFLAMLIGYLLLASAGMVLCDQGQEDIPIAEVEKRATEILRGSSAMEEISEWLQKQYKKFDTLERPAGNLKEAIKNLNVDQIRLLEMLNISVQRDCKLNLVGDDHNLKAYNDLPEILKKVIGDYIIVTGPDPRKQAQEAAANMKILDTVAPQATVKETKLSDDTVRVEVSQPAVHFEIQQIEQTDQKVGDLDSGTPTPAGQPAKHPVAPVVTPKPVEKIMPKAVASVKPIQTTALPVQPIKKQPAKVGPAGMMLPAPQLKQPMDRSKLSRMEIRRQRRARRRGMKPLPIATPIAPASAKPVVPIEAAKVVETVEMVVTEPAAPGVKAAEEPFKVPD